MYLHIYLQVKPHNSHPVHELKTLFIPLHMICIVMFVSHNQLHMSVFSGEVNLLGSAPGTVLHMFPQNMSHNETFQGLVEASWNGVFA